MSENKDIKHAQTVYKTLCEAFDELKYRYKKDDDNLTVSLTMQGDDLPMEMRIQVDADKKLITLLSTMPFSIPEDRRAALSVAVVKANSITIDGSFDYDYLTGRIVFRMTSCIRDSIIGKQLFVYMIQCACGTVDYYNDKFLMVAKSEMAHEEILKFIQ